MSLVRKTNAQNCWMPLLIWIKKCREIRDAGKIASVERIAIMAALNIAHELLTTKVGGGFDLSEVKRRMQAMQATIEATLVDQDELF